jgi:DNA-binding NarL/FixJ family response regulator
MDQPTPERRRRPFTRLKASTRQEAIRQAVADGIHDPKQIAERLHCTKELVLYYARRMPDLHCQQFRPGPKLRRRTTIGWALT